MFGLFKKRKPRTGMEMLIVRMYGSLDHKKTADLDAAIQIAYNDLLCECVPESDIRKKARELFASSIPFSTNDLALSVALAFFRAEANHELLKEVQLVARLQLVDWVKAGTVTKPLAIAFANTLHERFKPARQPA